MHGDMMERRKSRKPMNESERRRHGRTLPNPEKKTPERRANFDRWLDSQLKQAYDFVREEPLPPKLQDLLNRISSELTNPAPDAPHEPDANGKDKRARGKKDRNGKDEG